MRYSLLFKKRTRKLEQIANRDRAIRLVLVEARPPLLNDYAMDDIGMLPLDDSEVTLPIRVTD